MKRVLAVDIGASSYRVIEGIYRAGKLSMTELCRYKHAPVYEEGHYYWDIWQMKGRLVHAVRVAASKGEPITSIGFDSFGSDFGLLGKNGELLAKPLAYRDSISDGIYEKYFRREEQLYKKTGGTYATTSTAHILKGMTEQGFPALKNAQYLLFMPDLLAYLFTGNTVNEYTIATTSRLLDIERRKWDEELIRELGLPAQIFHPLSGSGTIVGKLAEEIRGGSPNLWDTVVTATACHDTAAAVAVIPPMNHCSFISSGSWSVKGVVSKGAFTTEKACRYKMSNEGQPEGRYRLIRNITGLWLLEECVRSWKEAGMEICIPELAEKAEVAESFPSMIYTDGEDFKKPGDMPDKIKKYCSRTGQRPPKTPLQTMQTIINGLVLEYRRHNEELQDVTGDRIRYLYIVGGGRNNRYLNQCAADATGCTVICGHPEAAALGNLLIQLWAQCEIDSVEEFAEIAARDVPEERFVPAHMAQWKERYQFYQKLIRQ